MVKVLEEKPVPQAEIRCDNCGSLLQYGNVDLTHDYERERENTDSYVNAWKHVYYCFNCPVCGCKVSANWITKKEN